MPRGSNPTLPLPKLCDWGHSPTSPGHDFGLRGIGVRGVVADCPAGWRWEVTELRYSGGWNRAKLGWNRRTHCRRSDLARSRHSGARDGELLLDSEGPGQPSPPCTLRCPTLTPVYVSYSSVPPIPPLPLCSALGSTSFDQLFGSQLK